MRFKLSFITNSSSCSFIMIGWEFTTKAVKEMRKKELASCKKLIEYWGSDGGSRSNDHVLLGREVARVEEYGFDSNSIGIEELVEDELLKEFAKTFDIQEKPRVFFGTKLC